MSGIRTYGSMVGLLALMSGCGGESPTAPNPRPTPRPAAAVTATPTATATATPAATATPVPTPNPNDPEAIFPGPVKTVKVRLYSVRAPNGDFRPEPFYDPRTDNDVAYKGDFIVLDVTAKNALGQKCESDRDPNWILENNRGIFSPRASSNPFLYRADLTGNGIVKVRADVDGVLSNLINIEVR